MSLPLPSGRNDALLARRRYIPSLRLVLFGDGPEYHAVAGLADAMGIELDGHRPATAQRRGLALGQGPMDLTVDPWTAIILLFHDHEWDRALLRWAVTTPAFFIGAQGGARAREQRGAALVTDGISAAAISRIRSPIGLFPHARDPDVLALSILAGVVSEFEALHPHP